MSSFRDEISDLIAGFRANRQQAREEANRAEERRRAFLADFNDRVNGTIERLVGEIREAIGENADITIEPSGDKDGLWFEVTVAATAGRSEAVRFAADPYSETVTIQKPQNGRYQSVNGGTRLELFRPDIIERHLVGILERVLREK